MIIDSCEDVAIVATPGNLQGPFSLSCGFGSSLGMKVEGMALDNPLDLKGGDPLPVSFLVKQGQLHLSPAQVLLTQLDDPELLLRGHLPGPFSLGSSGSFL